MMGILASATASAAKARRRRRQPASMPFLHVFGGSLITLSWNSSNLGRIEYSAAALMIFSISSARKTRKSPDGVGHAVKPVHDSDRLNIIFSCGKHDRTNHGLHGLAVAAACHNSDSFYFWHIFHLRRIAAKKIIGVHTRLKRARDYAPVRVPTSKLHYTS